MATVEETNKIIKEHLIRLPKEVRDIIEHSDWDQKIQEIGKKHGLRIDQIGALGNETMFALLGMTHPDQYVHEVQIHLNIVGPKAEAVAKDCQDVIFNSIHEKLKEVYNRDLEESDAEVEMTNKEQKTLERSGIEIENSSISSGNPVSVSIENRDTLIEEVEHPELIPNTPPKDIISSKLSGTFTIPKKESDTTLPNISRPPDKNRPVSSDPYREAI